MPYERAANLWVNSFLCLARDSLLKLSWSISGPLNGQQCLAVRKSKRITSKGYFLCGRSKYNKIGKEIIEAPLGDSGNKGTWSKNYWEHGD